MLLSLKKERKKKNKREHCCYHFAKTRHKTNNNNSSTMSPCLTIRMETLSENASKFSAGTTYILCSTVTIVKLFYTVMQNTTSTPSRW